MRSVARAGAEAKLLAEAHTFVVALRDLRTKTGKLIPAPRWFARLRDGGKLPAAERGQKARYATIFKALKRAGIARGKSLYEAWSFTVESRQNLTNGMRAIRNNAFGQLSDTNLADSVDSGHAPAFTVTDTKALVSSAGAPLTQVDGTLQVPCYLVACGPSTQPASTTAPPSPMRPRLRSPATWPPRRSSASCRVPPPR
jgi:hypothetical protein